MSWPNTLDKIIWPCQPDSITSSPDDARIKHGVVVEPG